MSAWLLRAWNLLAWWLGHRSCDGEGCGFCIPLEQCPCCERWHPRHDDTNVCTACMPVSGDSPSEDS